MRRQCHRTLGVFVLGSRSVREKVKIRVQVFKPADACIVVEYIPEQDRFAGEVELQRGAVIARSTQIVVPMLQRFNGDQLRSWQGECPEHVQRGSVQRSEEHTSELQSLAYLVCR